MTKKLERLRGGEGFTGNAPGGPSRWSTERSSEWEPPKPKLVVEVEYDHVTGDRFRHGTKFMRWRPDKLPRQCTYDQLKQEGSPHVILKNVVGDKMVAYSAGLLLFRRRTRGLEVFLIHPGGPYWAKKDEGSWSIPKGLIDTEEDRLAAAKREFKEETGFDVDGAFLELGMFRQPSGKRLFVWAVEGDCEPTQLVSNEFTMAWPPKSATIRSFPEVDRGEWFGLKEAAKRILKGQRPILEKFAELMV